MDSCTVCLSFGMVRVHEIVAHASLSSLQAERPSRMCDSPVCATRAWYQKNVFNEHPHNHNDQHSHQDIFHMLSI